MWSSHSRRLLSIPLFGLLCPPMLPVPARDGRRTWNEIRRLLLVGLRQPHPDSEFELALPSRRRKRPTATRPDERQLRRQRSRHSVGILPQHPVLSPDNRKKSDTVGPTLPCPGQAPHLPSVPTRGQHCKPEWLPKQMNKAEVRQPWYSHEKLEARRSLRHSPIWLN